MCAAGRGAMHLETKPLKMMPFRRVHMTDMGLSCNRRELNGDQQDRRSKYPQTFASRSHESLLPYDPRPGNNG